MTKKPDPTKLYLCVMSHTDGVTVVREGDRVRGDHPDIVKHFDVFYTDDGLPTDEVRAIQLRRFGNPG